MFDWFKPKNKKNIVLPSEKLGPLQGVELVQAFSTDDEPKIKDFPKDKYSVYWETFLDAIPGGYSATVKFYSRKGGIVDVCVLNSQTILELRQEVTALILKTMNENKV